MTHPGKTRSTLAVLIILMMVSAVVLAGCGSKTPQTKTGPTAKGSLPVAQSALSTMAPDAKLLVVQTAQAVTATATPVWGFLFGSPKSDKTYVVYVENGKAMAAQEYGTAGLTADEWKLVPGADGWTVDSDAAYKSAFETGGGKGTPDAYAMGFVTYVPKSAQASATVSPFVWSVVFQPGKSGVTTKTIEVDAKTGKASVSTK